MFELSIYFVIHLVLTWVFWHRLNDSEGKGVAVFFVQGLVLALVAVVIMLGVFAPHWLQVENRWIAATVMSSIPEELFKWGAALFVIRWLDVRSMSSKVSIIVYTAIAFGTFESMLYLVGLEVTSFSRLIPTIMHAACGMIVAEGVVVRFSRINRRPEVGLGIAMLIHAAHNLLAGGEAAVALLLWTNWLFALGIVFLFANGVGRLLFSRVESEAAPETDAFAGHSPDLLLAGRAVVADARNDVDERGQQAKFERLSTHSGLIAALLQSGWIRTCHVCQSDVAIGPSGIFPCPDCGHEFRVSVASRKGADDSAAFLNLLLNHGVLLLDLEFERLLRRAMKRPTARVCKQLRALIQSGRKDVARLTVRIEGHIYNAFDLSSMQFHVYPNEQQGFDAFVLSGSLAAIAGNSVQALIDEGLRRQKWGKRFLILAFAVIAAIGAWQMKSSGVLQVISVTQPAQSITFVQAKWRGGSVASQQFLDSWMKHYSDGVSLNMIDNTTDLRSVISSWRVKGRSNEYISNFLILNYACEPRTAGLLSSLTKVTLDLGINAEGKVTSVEVKPNDLPLDLKNVAIKAALEMSHLWEPAMQDGIPVHSNVIVAFELDLLDEGWEFQW